MPADSLDEYRSDADRFTAELMEEYYLHFAGLKDRLELTPIYERHAELTSLEWCRRLGDEAADARPRSGRAELWRFACEGFLANLAREQEERIAELETTLTAEVDGDEIGYRMLRPRIANEPQRELRRRLEEARTGLVEELNPVYVEGLERAREGVRELGAATLRELYESFGFGLEALGGQCERFLAETEELYEQSFGSLLETRVGVPLADAGRWDVPRALRAPVWDEDFPADRMLPALEHTLADLGIELRRQQNVELDVDVRPTKAPRAFCAPIEVPARIVLVVQPIGGLDDWRALFHEAGHAEHFAHTSAHLPVEARRFGDNAVTECWAFLLEHLVTDPAWLTRRLDAARPDELAAESRAVLLYYVRRYCAKLLYELKLHGGASLDELPELYEELLTGATKLRYDGADFLADVDPGFYSTSYLRAWALEAQLVELLRREHGRAWFAQRKAAGLVRELWSEGQGLDADTIAREVTGQALDLAVLHERIAAAE